MTHSHSDPQLESHKAWLGYVQPVGVVVSPTVLLEAQAQVDRNIGPLHSRFLKWVQDVPLPGSDREVMILSDLPGFLQDVLGWDPDVLVRAENDPDLEVTLPEYGETLRPTYAAKSSLTAEPSSPPLLLIQSLPMGTDPDAQILLHDQGWKASPQARFERLLRETQIPIGLLFNGASLRLVYAPRGETSGHITFEVQFMAEVGGRPIFAGLCMLLCQERLFTLPDSMRLGSLLERSRKFQNQVSTQLAEQVLNALYELVRGFQAAHEQSQYSLLQETLAQDPNHVYKGLLTVLMRMVFLLYAEDRGLMSSDPVYTNYYSISKLFEKLRNDNNRHPETMNQRYGAWAQLLSLFRMVHDGARHQNLHIPAREGYLFNPDRYPFLEGRPYGVNRVLGQGLNPPKVSDGVVFRVLQDLVILDGERISYRNLDVEQIGSVYESIMGFQLQVAEAPCIAIRSGKTRGAPVTLNLERLLSLDPKKRAEWLRKETDQTLTGEPATRLQQAQTLDDLVAALDKKISPTSRGILPKGAMILQPSDERRRSGSHYTPRSLTEPIVRATLRPVLACLGESPEPEQILDLKVCDMAMGSGAFLVETCRQLADRLVQSWHNHKSVPPVPPDEDEVLFAQRLVAQRCLYGVDKNDVAADLARLALWLATLAKDHPFTFVDHALRHGDSLVGLSTDSIKTFHWSPGKQLSLLVKTVESKVDEAAIKRRAIHEGVEKLSDHALRELLKDSNDALDDVRLIADLVIAAFFGEDNTKDRDKLLSSFLVSLEDWIKNGCGFNQLKDHAQALRTMERPITPFHWQIEFPEVFNRENPGFDAMVGNPPFAGKNNLINGNAEGYLDWVKDLHPESHGNADLVSHFFRRAFDLIRSQGTFGLIATNTIGQGDTRATGLRWICTHNGTIYQATRRLKWPGLAAVVVSVVHVKKEYPEEEALMVAEPSAQYVSLPPGGGGLGLGGKIPVLLDNRPVPLISAFLFHAGGHENPKPLAANAGKSFIGSYVLGMGFTFDDTDTKGVASPIAEMKRLIEKDPRNKERIFPYIGGEEVNTSPTQAYHRYVINFGDMSEEEARRWPDLMRIVEERVKPQRDQDNRDVRRKYWWRFGETTPALFSAIRGMERVVVVAQTSNALAFTFLPATSVFGLTLTVFPLNNHAFFSVLQSRIHQTWALFFAAKMKDDARYIPSDCFETFPFPERYSEDGRLEQIGRIYYDFREKLMIKNQEGLTKTYNRFHDPEERSPEILRLRELHANMDRTVLDAYGWTDIEPQCDFILDYEEDEDEEEAGRHRKKPYRYRWLDDIRDEVLARLMTLNHKRAQEEAIAGPKPKKPTRKPKPQSRHAHLQETL